MIFSWIGRKRSLEVSPRARLVDDAEIAVFPVPNTAGEGPRFSPDDRYLAFRTAASDRAPAELFVWDLSRHDLVLRRSVAAEGLCFFWENH